MTRRCTECPDGCPAPGRTPKCDDCRPLTDLAERAHIAAQTLRKAADDLDRAAKAGWSAKQIVLALRNRADHIELEARIARLERQIEP